MQVTDTFSEKRFRQEFPLVRGKAAILVVDMLNDFLEDGGVMVLAEGRSLYDPIGRLVEAGRGVGTRVIWVCDEHSEFDKEFEKRVPHCIEGSWGAQIVDALHREPGEYVIRKRRYSGFYQTDLDLRLRELGIQHLIVTGIVTNICVRSTIHDAFFRGYDVIVPNECVAATSDREQASSLYDIDTHYGKVASLDDVLRILASGGAEPVPSSTAVS
jgi:ureidoacrylate peracid hydrolase